jgi:hypothetical protein
MEDKVGELYKYIKIIFGPKGKNYADAAIAKITITDYLVGEVLDSDNQNTYTINGTIEVSIGILLGGLEGLLESPSAPYSILVQLLKFGINLNGQYSTIKYW